MGAWVAARWLAVRDLRLLRVFAVLRDGDGRSVVPDSEGAEASLRDVLAAALDANREMARLAAELREENGKLREENAAAGGGRGAGG